VILGVFIIKDIFLNKKHIHKHNHDGEMHVHLHSHKTTEAHHHHHYHKSFAVGLVHGMAGSASLMLLVLSTMNSILLGLVYIFLFGIGSMLGMAIVGGIISLPFIYTSKKYMSINNKIRYITGFFSIAFGSFIMIKIIYFEGLFSL